jgi:hypothetical protein
LELIFCGYDRTHDSGAGRNVMEISESGKVAGPYIELYQEVLRKNK